MKLQAKNLLDEVKQSGNGIVLIHGEVFIKGQLSGNLMLRIQQELLSVVEVLEERQQAKDLLDEVKKAGHEVVLKNGVVFINGGISGNLKKRVCQTVSSIIEVLEEMQEESNVYKVKIGNTDLKMICPSHLNLDKTKELVNSQFPDTLNEVDYARASFVWI